MNKQTGGCDYTQKGLQCNTYKANIKSNSGSKLSPSVLSRAKKCYDQDMAAGASGIDDDDFDSDESASGCGQWLNSTACRDMNAGLSANFKTDMNNSRDRVLDAKRAINDSKKEFNQLKRESKTRITELEGRLDEAGANLKKNGRAILDKLKKEQAASDAGMRDMMRQMQAQYNKWDEAYVKMRAAYRQAEAAISQAKYQVETECRKEAQARLDETNKRIRERTDGLVGKKVNQSTSRVAGGKKRRFAEYERLRQTQYAEAFRMCLGGESPGGSAANNAIKTAKDNLELAKAELADQQAVIEKQRLQLMKTYEEEKQAADKAKVDMAQQAQQMQEEIYQEYQMALKQIEREYANEQQTMQDALNEFNESAALNYQTLANAQSEEFTDKARYQCAMSNGGSIAEAQGQRRLQQNDDAMAALGAVEGDCNQMRGSGCTGIPSICSLDDGGILKRFGSGSGGSGADQ